jgi:hypothetical protein
MVKYIKIMNFDEKVDKKTKLSSKNVKNYSFLVTF